MPKKMVIEALGEKRHSFELQELALLKQEFGISMQSILYRARHCHVINEKLHSSNIHISELPGERPFPLAVRNSIINSNPKTRSSTP